MDTQSIIGILGIGISTIAGVVTAGMAVETRRMATAATKALDLEQAPILGLRDIKVEVGVGEALRSRPIRPPVE